MNRARDLTHHGRSMGRLKSVLWSPLSNRKVGLLSRQTWINSEESGRALMVGLLPEVCCRLLMDGGGDILSLILNSPCWPHFNSQWHHESPLGNRSCPWGALRQDFLCQSNPLSLPHPFLVQKGASPAQEKSLRQEDSPPT